VNSRVFFWALVFYLSKYYEFIDTVILALRKKPLTFLHVYHHLVTAGVVYLLVIGQVSLTWLLVFLNSTVHTFMYYYYTVSLLGSTVWWKKYLTSGQIVQFFILLGAACVQLFVFKLPPFLIPNPASPMNYHLFSYWRYVVGSPLCSGDMLYFGLGFGFTASLVVLFMQFYQSTYKRPAVTKPKTN
jgi:fatty acid elongase 3